jgi:hypothetical protein
VLLEVNEDALPENSVRSNFFEQAYVTDSENEEVGY